MKVKSIFIDVTTCCAQTFLHKMKYSSHKDQQLFNIFQYGEY
jgi:hypothetical protein